MNNKRLDERETSGIGDMTNDVNDEQDSRKQGKQGL